MQNNQRILVKIVQDYGRLRGIPVALHCQDWLITIGDGATRRLVMGYDLGLNSSVAHRVANDKTATSELLEHTGVPSVPHALFLSPRLSRYVPEQGSWTAMLALLDRHGPRGIVVKPNEGTGGTDVFRVRTRAELELAAHTVFSSSRSLAVSPYLDISEEVRVILLDQRPLVVYRKVRPVIEGDGHHTMLELIARDFPGDESDKIVATLVKDGGDPDQIVGSGVRRALSWRHNLGSGARPELLAPGELREACVAMAMRAAEAIGMRFCSVDVVQAGGALQVLEVNSGVMMEALAARFPDLVAATYASALDALFAQDCRGAAAPPAGTE